MIHCIVYWVHFIFFSLHLNFISVFICIYDRQICKSRSYKYIYFFRHLYSDNTHCVVCPSMQYARENERAERQHGPLSLQHYCLRHITSVSLRALDCGAGKNSLIPYTHHFFLLLLLLLLSCHVDEAHKKIDRCSPFFFLSSLVWLVSKFSSAIQTLHAHRLPKNPSSPLAYKILTIALDKTVSSKAKY